jgi:hypothetical protein
MSISSYAQVGTTGAEFLNTCLGARPSGMGNAFSAIADDVNAILWNPAGLTLLNNKEASFTYTDIGTIFDVSGAGSMYDGFLGYAQPLKNGDAAAISLQYQEQGKIAYTTESPEVIAEYNLGANYAAILSYAKKLSSSLSWGASFKFIQTKLWRETGQAYAVDLGGLYQTQNKNLTIGLSLQNTGTKLKMEDREQADPLPQNLKLGISYKLLTSNPHSLIFGFDIDKPTASDTSATLSLGTEYWYRGLIALRLGYLNKEGNVKGMTQGIGIRYRGYGLDFANVPWGELGHVQLISLTIKF